MSDAKDSPVDLREACIHEALAIIEASGLEKLSLREVARRLGVSHQAPYKHFPSRDHILAEIIRRCFEAFAEYLDARPRSQDPNADMAAMGRAYLSYAHEHPLQYRLMFATPLPDPDAHPEMMSSARHAFSLLHHCVLRMNQAHGTTLGQLDSLFVWATMHGLASVLQSPVMGTLEMSPELLRHAPEHTLLRIGLALGVEDQG